MLRSFLSCHYFAIPYLQSAAACLPRAELALRRCAYDFRDVYYYKAYPRAKEVDFIVCDKDKALELIQVAYEIDTQKSFNRETSALVQAAGPLHCDNLTLIAFSPTRDVVLDGKTIHVVSAVEWLLS